MCIKVPWFCHSTGLSNTSIKEYSVSLRPVVSEVPVHVHTTHLAPPKGVTQ